MQTLYRVIPFRSIGFPIRKMSGKCGRKSTALQVVKDLDLSGKYYLITGANTGIGFETARALALKNGHVTIACRNEATAKEAKNKIIAEKPDAHLDILQLDNNDLKSVDACAKNYLDKDCPLHCLILNAGVFGPTQRETSTGIETTFHINHLAHFHLEQLLEPKLIESAPSRIVVVASYGSTMVKYGTDEVTWEKMSPTVKTGGPNGITNAYNTSKFCNVLHAMELNRRLKEKNVTAYSLHPGMIKTEIARNLGFNGTIFNFAASFFKSLEQGAATTVYCATAPEIEETGGGKYFTDCSVAQQTPFARNPESAKKLWELSQKMISETHKKSEGT